MNIIRFVRDDGEILELTENWGIYDLEGLSYPDVSFDTEPYAFYDGSYFTKSHAASTFALFAGTIRPHPVSDANAICSPYCGTGTYS